MMILIKNLLETVNLFSKNNTVFFYGTFPGPGVNVRMYKQINNMYPETNQQFAIKEKSKVEKLLLKEDTDNLHVINPIDIFCSPNLCEYFSDSYYFYIDHIHFGYFGAEKISDHFVDNFLDKSFKKP